MLRVLFLLSCIIYTTNACSCMQRHPQTIACEADFVILARILTRKAISDPHGPPYSDRIGYKLKIMQIFKSTKEAEEILTRKRFLTTGANDGICGVTLQIKQLYLIAGRLSYDKTTAAVSTCDFTEPWNHLSLVQRKGFRKLYYESCNCKIRPCWNIFDNSCTKLNANGCGWIDDTHECESRDTVCTRNHKNQCHWQENRYFSHCKSLKNNYNSQEDYDNGPRIEP